MKSRGVLTAFSAMLLLAGMFAAVHRGARGRAIVEHVRGMSDRRESAEARLSELQREIEQLLSRTRIVRAAERLGLHLPSEEELVILDISGEATQSTGGAP